MWKEIVTDELRELAREYYKRFNGAFVDGYDDFNFNAMSYEGDIVRARKCQDIEPCMLTQRQA